MKQSPEENESYVDKPTDLLRDKLEVEEYDFEAMYKHGPKLLDIEHPYSTTKNPTKVTSTICFELSENFIHSNETTAITLMSMKIME